MSNYSVFGVGNPLMDIIGRVSTEQLHKLGVTPGSMTLVDVEHAAQIVKGLDQIVQRPGGSCANTLRGIAWLAQHDRSHTHEKPLLTGVIGNDTVGRDLIRGLRDAGVATRLSFHSSERTGTSSVLVTPDGQRTMFTSLGASQNLLPKHLDRHAIAHSSCFYATAFLWGLTGGQETLFAGAAAARDKGSLVAFDVADPFVVSMFGHELLKWIPNSVDLLFANEQEARALAMLIDGKSGNGDPESACASVSSLASTVVIKVGADGSMVWQEGELVSRASGVPASAIDTTGAGDSFAAGFLYGMLAGGSPTDAATLGNRVGAAIVEVEGCDYPAVDSGFSV